METTAPTAHMAVIDLVQVVVRLLIGAEWSSSKLQPKRADELCRGKRSFLTVKVWPQYAARSKGTVVGLGRHTNPCLPALSFVKCQLLQRAPEREKSAVILRAAVAAKEPREAKSSGQTPMTPTVLAVESSGGNNT